MGLKLLAIAAHPDDASLGMGGGLARCAEERRRLAIDPTKFRRIGRSLVDAIADHLATLPSRPVTRGGAPDAIRALLDGDAVDDDIALAARLHDRVAEHPELEPCTHALSITTFRFVPADLRSRVGDPAIETYPDSLNAAILDRIQRDGDAFVSNAVVRGRYVFRACIVYFNTQPADIDALPAIVTRLGAALDAELRPGAGV